MPGEFFLKKSTMTSAANLKKKKKKKHQTKPLFYPNPPPGESIMDRKNGYLVLRVVCQAAILNIEERGPLHNCHARMKHKIF